MNLIEKMFGTHSERELKLIYPIVDKIVALKPEMEKLTDDELKDNTRKFRERLEKGETLEYTKEAERLNQQKMYQERAAFFHRARSLDDITGRDEAR